MRVALRVLVAATAVLVALAAAAGLTAAPAAAHAALASSVPAAGSSVPQSPPTIVLTFTENPDPVHSLVRLVDAGGQTVPGVSPVQAVPGKPLAIQVTLSRTLRQGVYTVNWRSVSATDGHVESGAFAFGVAVTPAPGSAVEVPVLHTSGWADWLGAVGRWLLYAGLALLVGAAYTCLLVFGGRLPAGGVTLTRVALLLGGVGLALLVWAERDLIGAPSLLPLFETPEGQLLLYLGVALLMCAAAVVALDVYPGRGTLIALGVTAVAAVFVHVLAGHADAASSLRVLNLLVQWVHMSAIGVWVGGLAWLLLGIRGMERGERAAAVRRFSLVATVTLVVVLVTGATRGVLEIGTPANLVHTGYGITLLVKVGLVVALVALGALNHFRWVPALDEEEGAARPFRLNSRAELALAACVLAATALLSGLAPAKPVSGVAGARLQAVPAAVRPAAPPVDSPSFVHEA